MSVLRIRGRALPGGELVDLYADGDRWTDDPVAGAELVAQGWLLPGLVDAHTHPGADTPGRPLDEKLLRADLAEHLGAGVTLIRAPGLAPVRSVRWPPPGCRPTRRSARPPGRPGAISGCPDWCPAHRPTRSSTTRTREPTSIGSRPRGRSCCAASCVTGGRRLPVVNALRAGSRS